MGLAVLSYNLSSLEGGRKEGKERVTDLRICVHREMKDVRASLIIYKAVNVHHECLNIRGKGLDRGHRGRLRFCSLTFRSWGQNSCFLNVEHISTLHGSQKTVTLRHE